jgi:hypothetical protein
MESTHHTARTVGSRLHQGACRRERERDDDDDDVFYLFLRHIPIGYPRER